MNTLSPFPTMSKYTAFRCPEDLLELAKIKAKKDRRSLSNYIITLIEKDVQSEAQIGPSFWPYPPGSACSVIRRPEGRRRYV
jgi:hypothetical protein